MAEVISIKMENSLIERIMAFAKSKEMNRSEAIKHLIDLGLKLNDIRENAEDDLTEERDKMLMEVWLGVKGISAVLKKVNSETLEDDYFIEMSELLKEKFNQKFIKLSEAYHQKPPRN